MAELALDRNQRTPEKDGVWMFRRQVTLGIVTGNRNAMFDLPKGCHVLGGFVTIETAAGGTVTAVLNLENDGGDVALFASALDLTAAAGTKKQIDVADEGVEVDVGTGTSVAAVLDVTSTTPTGTSVVTAGLLVARSSYTR